MLHRALLTLAVVVEVCPEGGVMPHAEALLERYACSSLGSDVRGSQSVVTYSTRLLSIIEYPLIPAEEGTPIQEGQGPLSHHPLVMEQRLCVI